MGQTLSVTECCSKFGFSHDEPAVVSAGCCSEGSTGAMAKPTESSEAAREQRDQSPKPVPHVAHQLPEMPLMQAAAVALHSQNHMGRLGEQNVQIKPISPVSETAKNAYPIEAASKSLKVVDADESQDPQSGAMHEEPLAKLPVLQSAKPIFGAENKQEPTLVSHAHQQESCDSRQGAQTIGVTPSVEFEEGTKKNDSSTSPAKSASVSQYHEFTVDVSKVPGVRLGIDVDFKNKNYLIVEKVYESGLVGSYNDAVGDPSLTVLAGDYIVAVNDESGDSLAMVERCKTDQKLQFKVHRMKPPALATIGPKSS